MMKRTIKVTLLVVLLACLFACSLTACGANKRKGLQFLLLEDGSYAYR